MDIRLRTPGLLLLGLLLSAPALAGEKSWPAVGLTTVEIGSTSGDLELRGWEGAEVKVVAEDVEQIAAEQQAGTLLLRGNLDLIVYLPAALKVSVQGVSGDVRARAVDGRLRIQTVSGNVRLEGVGAGLEVITVSGDVEARGVKGDVSLKTISGEQAVNGLVGERLEASSVSGEIRVRDAELREVKLKSHSGDVDLSGKVAADGRVRLSSFSGDVRIGLPRGTGFELEAETDGGEIRVGPEVVWSERNAERAVGRAGQGGLELRMSSRSGDLTVRNLD